jgi:RNA polymerase sigma-70 factor (ECF subfamily)
MTTRGAINSEKQPDRLRLHLYNGWDRGGQRLEFYIFDGAYVKRLAEGDPATESHFSVYFGKFIVLKLRARRLSPSLAEDVQQETMFRVLKALRQGSGVTQPERFGAFVNSVCNNVVLEFLHKESRHPSAPENSPEPADDRVDMDASLITRERKQIVAEVLDGLGSKDKEILRLVFLEETGRDEVCRKLGVRSEYLRVLLHRAKEKFEQAYLRKRGATRQQARTLFCW